MPLATATLLAHRSLIRLSGPDHIAFLQGLISNDVSKAAAGQAIYAALLTPQGKFLHDMFVVADHETLLLECATEQVEMLIRRLTAYKLRSKVVFEDLRDIYDVWAVWNGSISVPHSFIDPRLPELGQRCFLVKNTQPANVLLTGTTTYDLHRLSLGIPDRADFENEKSTLIECNFDFLNGIDWKKGCYIGQELTARMHYRGLAKKRLFPVKIEGKPPTANAVFDQDSGEMRSHNGQLGLALLRIEAVQQALAEQKPLTYGETRLWPQIPAWMKIDAAPANR